MTGARALHIQMVLFADAMCRFIREWPEPNTRKRCAVLFLWREFCQAVVVNQAKIHALHKSKLFCHGFGLEQLVLVTGLADGLYKRAVDVVCEDLVADFHLAKIHSTVATVYR